MKRQGKFLMAFGVFALVTSAVMVQDAHALTPVDLELQLLVDVSSSINATEFNLQKTGYANAFEDAALVNSMTSGPNGKIAVEMIFWSSGNQQQVMVGWTEISDATTAQNFANSIKALNRPFSGNTAPGSAIAFGDDRFFSNDFDGTRLVMDVSGDGTKNSGVDTAAARDAALALGIDTINGLVIGGDSLKNWYAANVIGGDGAFVEQASTFGDFGAGIKRKLGREIPPPPPTNAIPEPTSLLLLGSGLIGMLKLRNKKA